MRFQNPAPWKPYSATSRSLASMLRASSNQTSCSVPRPSTYRNQGDCGHVKGQEYGGQLCYASLEGASDAYEFSFVAVPAQPAAGVVKSVRRDGGPGLERLKEEAALGRKYLEHLRGEVVRLALLADRELDGRAMKSLADKLSPLELEELCRSFARRAEVKRGIPPVKYFRCFLRSWVIAVFLRKL